VHNTGEQALTRRSFVGKVATTVAAGVAGVAVATQRTNAALHQGDENVDPVRSDASLPVDGGSETPQEITFTSPPPWELLTPLAPGAVLAGSWHVAALDGVLDGSSALTLQNKNGRSQRLHICRNDGSPRGLVYTDRFDLVVMNGGRGDLPTEEGFGQAVAEVAHVIAANEARGQHDALLRDLLPQSEREQRFAATARLR
jgi:hypothetical protein